MSTVASSVGTDATSTVGDTVAQAAARPLPSSSFLGPSAREAADVPLPSSSAVGLSAAQTGGTTRAFEESLDSFNSAGSGTPQPIVENIRQHVHLRLERAAEGTRFLGRRFQQDWTAGLSGLNRTLVALTGPAGDACSNGGSSVGGTTLGGEHECDASAAESEVVDDVVETLEAAGSMHERSGDYRAARDLFAEVLRVQRLILGENDPAIAITLCRLGDLHHKCGRPVRALGSYRRALKIKRNLLGRYHPEVAATLNVVGQLYEDADDAEKAMETYKEALEIYNRNTFHTLQPADVVHYNNHQDVASVNPNTPASTKFDRLKIETKLSELQMSFAKKMERKKTGKSRSPLKRQTSPRRKNPGVPLEQDNNQLFSPSTQARPLKAHKKRSGSRPPRERRDAAEDVTKTPALRHRKKTAAWSEKKSDGTR
eukprot:CAMPEP_0194334342 /NCGR_PEP_ID=MMETSP0171-20130528/65813_1 /TAXON_ID=218684 /ORGANISM="Corethron pennatum, Strain L29A3" /LENGTH=427 /DNA_ID=CAMNT_0039096953 /DNA_START=178 /DNA_END=1457 /DNA_ORIENTATION=+